MDDQNVATVELIHMSNKFHDLDPTHFRYVAHAQVNFQGVSTFLQMEVHLDKIAAIGLDPSNQAYEHYNYLTRLAATVPEAKLNQLPRRSSSSSTRPPSPCSSRSWCYSPRAART